MCSQNLCGSFVRAILATKVSECSSNGGRRYDWYLQHQGEFQHINCMLWSLHDSDHDSVGRFFVGHS